MSTSSTTKKLSDESDVPDKEYFCFLLKEGFSLWDYEAIVNFPRLLNYDLQAMRTQLWKQFGVPKNRRIFYIDDDGDRVPIDSECEFDEALKLAKKAFMVNTAVPLIVGSFKMSTLYSNKQSSKMNKTRPNKESKNTNDDPMSCFVEKSDGSVSEPNSGFDKRKRPILKVLIWSRKKSDVKRCDESSSGATSKEQIKLEGTKIESIKYPKKSNALLRCSDTMPPPWFIEYMEAMKKDMVSTITKEVVKKVTVELNKRLDSFACPPLKEELGQSRSQSYSSLSKRHPKCSFDSNEKNQKRMSSQDEEQSSDASIERVDEPQNVNTTEDLQTKKDMISTISQEVVKEMTEMLNKTSLTSVSSKRHGQSRNQSNLSSLKRFSRYFDPHSSEKNQRKMRSQDGEQSSDDASMEHMYESRNVNIADVSRQKKLDHLIEDTICANMKEEKRKRKYHQLIASETTDNINSDVGKEQSRSNMREDFVPQKNLPLHVDPIPYDETKGVFENELRMSCSVTRHQILDEGRRRDTWCSDIDKTSFCSCNQEEEDDDAFEIIQMPTLGSRDESFTHSEELAAEQRRHDSNRDSPSFELLSESPSPTPTCFMHFNEEHFSANEGNPEYESFSFLNSRYSSIYVIDIHGRIYTDYELAKLNWQSVNADLKKRIDKKRNLYITDQLQNTRCSNPILERSNECKKNPRDDIGCNTHDNASNSYDDVRNSHTSYLTVRTQCDSKSQSRCSRQSQTDLNDFIQSFHSHATSVTDTTDVYTEAYGNDKYDDQVTTAKNVQEAGTGTAAATATATVTATATATATPRNDHDVRFGGDYIKDEMTDERYFPDADDYPEDFCTSHDNTSQGIVVDPPYQSTQSSRSSDRASSNVGSKKTFIGETLDIHWRDPDHAHILPELVTAAAHVGSFAYDTAREVFDKIRAHTREDSVKRQASKYVQAYVKRDDRVLHPKRRNFQTPFTHP
ncbi:PREDICTED: uncharacterized protein LOC108757874 [Trachymyrmex cornetzi]|uniref:PB1 domain-containing protein n=1 Tax=Trachymyrmex cornetzi TaxID=471704 RepID=A0A195EGP0_9HYME|nr:PREDICTED: uncharacterized protein LOC108757874 [Trachymyrmex cornetzi]KYN27311.1 hypothetical protein ALC57_03655 [Trachymyrmex cornetzi]